MSWMIGWIDRLDYQMRKALQTPFIDSYADVRRKKEKRKNRIRISSLIRVLLRLVA
jgi:hypothetical protein